ncbi:hypothetical protein F4778DRAFT_388387 [Xylariomycetidae sp. FL2044]|nr:hypothetical protein F4778DRAFT_388387 [Xylariomycetidae sp. FL2044]
MYRSALRASPRIANSLRRPAVAATARRFASTSPADKKRGWKNTTLRYCLALGAIYWYSTSSVFADHPEAKTIPPPPQFSDDDLPTVEAVVAQKRREAEARLQKSSPTTYEPADGTAPTAPAKDVESPDQVAPRAEGSPEALEEEAGQQGAFNPETGEINWDCPCLGGMANGPCGEEFKAAFSCFVYSKEEPKGMDCIDKFQHMQDCFRQHPDVYGEELADEAAAEEEAAAAEEAAGSPADATAAKEASSESSPEPRKETSPIEAKLHDRKTGEPQPDRKETATSASES